MATEYQLQTATPLHYRKFRGSSTAVWARDHAYPVTRTMAMPTSYDHLTPPYSAAHNKPLPPTPRQTQKTTAPTSLFAGGPHASSPRPGAGPREQDDLYYATFTPNAYNTSSPPAAQDVSRKLTCTVHDPRHSRNSRRSCHDQTSQ
jgi:hypothetical protein